MANAIFSAASSLSLSAPHNGTTAYELDTTHTENADTATYDMFIDNAIAINKQMVTDENTYYFSIACSATDRADDGTYKPDKKIMELMFRSDAESLGSITGTTTGGFVVDESWLENDGLVNTVSAKAPTDAPSKDFEADNIPMGVWNIMPVYRGDHMSLQGGFFKVNTDVERLYTEHFDMINRLG